MAVLDQQKVKSNLEEDIKILQNKKNSIQNEIKNMDATLKEAIDLILIKERKVLAEKQDELDSKIIEVNNNLSKNNELKKQLEVTKAEVNKRVENLERDQRANEVLSQALHSTKDKLMSLSKYIVEVVSGL